MDNLDTPEVLTLVFIGVSAFLGAAIGWFSGGNLLATAGGFVVSGTLALFLVTVVSLGVAGVSRLIERRGRR